MKKINILLIILNIILVLLILIKLSFQKQNYEYEIADENATLEEVKYDLSREIYFGVKEYSKSENGVRVNNSEEIKKDITLSDGLIVKDFDIKYKNLTTIISATVANESENEMGDYPAYLVLYNDQNEEINRIQVYIDKISPNSETLISTSIFADISGVYKIEIEKVEEAN